MRKLARYGCVMKRLQRGVVALSGKFLDCKLAVFIQVEFQPLGDF